MAFRKGLIPVRVELLDGMTAMRAVPDLETTTLVRAFNDCNRVLDEGCSFDWPKSARDVQSSHAARRINGYVKRNGDVIGTCHIAFEGEERHFRDIDPTNERDRLRLS